MGVGAAEMPGSSVSVSCGRPRNVCLGTKLISLFDLSLRLSINGRSRHSQPVSQWLSAINRELVCRKRAPCTMGRTLQELRLSIPV